ncbi:dihydrolipoyl dehydrogenase family protein [Bacillus sp. 2205SS5-2]|uniref:dihydrolipoyl dehydrogenase family protein n=1 Tax=Bacillus sp. 2205SS5-2 TaxID=3109031 RepID=UPI003004B165
MVVGELAEEKELVIIGGGPGGYHAAIRAAQLGMEVTLIEKGELGGTCLHLGCIPSKVFTTLAKRKEEMSHSQNLGLAFNEPTINLAVFQEYKTKLTTQLGKGVDALCKVNKVEVLKGKASFLSEDRIGIENNHDFQVLKFQNCIIATGGSLEQENWVPKGSNRMLNPFTVFQIEDIPEHIILYGQDYITLELAFSFQAIGSKVTLIAAEEMDLDETISREVKRLLKKKKIHYLENYQVQNVHEGEDHFEVILQNGTGDIVTVEGSDLYVTGEFKPKLQNLGLERLPIKTNEGYITVDNQCRTSIATIYAIGDVTEGPSLAVKAIKQGKTAVESIKGLVPEYDGRYLPKVMHTLPPIATVGLTEAEAKIDYEIVCSVFPLAGNGYATVTGANQGLVKVIKEKGTDLLLGVHMMGMGAIELISSATIGLETVAREEDLLYPMYPHPSVNEGLLEAIEALEGKAIHLVPQKQTILVNN